MSADFAITHKLLILLPIMPTSSVRPFSPEHSINEVAFIVHFAQVLSENTLRRLKELEPQYKDELPKLEEDQAAGIRINGSTGESELLPNKLSAVSFKQLNSKGDLSWALRAEQNILVVNCLDYCDGWKTVWPKASKYLSIAVPVATSPDNPIVSIGLQYIDKFIYEGNVDSYRTDHIFNIQSPYLSQQINESGPLWHINQGWFEAVGDYSMLRVLNRLNLTAALADKEHHTSIDHSAIMQFRQPVSNSKSLLEEKISDQVKMEYYFNHLHIVNKKILAKLLNEERIKEINLLGEQG